MLATIVEDWQRRRELQAVNRRIAQEPEPALPRFVAGHHRGPVWQLLVPGGPPAFMCLGYREAFVVHVRASAFHRAWLATGRALNQPCPRRDRFAQDRKFHWAISGFSQGIENPVPLAEVTATDWQGKRQIAFTNGITRTLWLLAHDVPAFPVQCWTEDEAVRVFEVAGLTPPIHVEELPKA